MTKRPEITIRDRRQGRIESFERRKIIVTGKIPNLKSHVLMCYYFRVRAANGMIIAQSEAYNTKRARDNGIRALVAVCVSVGLGDR